MPATKEILHELARIASITSISHGPFLEPAGDRVTWPSG